MIYDLGDVMAATIVGLASLLAGLGIFALTQDHKITRYYVGNPQTTDQGIAVFAERNWAPDDLAFTTDDIQKAASVVERLNAGLNAPN